MKRWLMGFMLFAALVGCSSRSEPEPEVVPEPTNPPTQNAPEQPTEERELVTEPFTVGRFYGPDNYPPKRWGTDGSTSPNGTWEVRTRMADHSKGELWVVQNDGSTGLFVSNNLLYPGQMQPVWTLDNRLLFYVGYGGDETDLWYVANPETGEIAPFHPDRLQGRLAGRLVPLPDGEHLLVTTNFCGSCNKPSANTLSTYRLHIATGEMQLLGVDVDVTVADDGTLSVTGQLPHLGYSGPPPFHSLGEEPGTTTAPVSLSFQIGATDQVEYLIYGADASTRDEPLRQIPAYNGQTNYNLWTLWWPEAPPGEYRIETWAQVRTAAPDTEKVERIGSERWVHLGTTPVKVLPREVPDTSTPLWDFHIVDKHVGWGLAGPGRIWRTYDGGENWADVTPPTSGQCDGRLMQRHVAHFSGSFGVRAAACSYTDHSGSWSPDSSQIHVYWSDDLGESWESFTINTPFEHATPVDVVWVADRHGWVLAGEWSRDWRRGSLLFRTQDGGRTWDSFAVTPGASQLSFVSPLLGAMKVPGGFAISRDGGESWQVHHVSDQVIFSQAPQFYSETLGLFSVGPLWQRKLFITTDGGASWRHAADLPGESNPVFLSEKLAYLWEYETRRLHWSRDGGATWSTQQSELRFTKVQFLGESHGYGLDISGHLYETHDGGATWTLRAPQG